MNHPDDAFLLLLRHQPDPSFERALRQRLHSASAKPSVARHWLKYIAAVGIVFTLAMIALPEVRAQIVQGIYSLFYGDVELRIIDHNLSGGSHTSVPIDIVSPAEAQSIFAHLVPTWIPDGFTLSGGVHIVHYSAHEIGIGYIWTTATDDQKIVLSIMNNPLPKIVIGEGGEHHTVEIHGREGGFFSGSWNNGVFEPEGYRNLIWAESGLYYLLGSTLLPESDLLKMAESMR